MQVAELKLDRAKARELYRSYKKHQHYDAPLDAQIMRTYQLIAQGRVVIQAHRSIIEAGFGADGHPKLALMRADKTHCWVRHWEKHVRFMAESWSRHGSPECQVLLPSASNKTDGRAVMPIIPAHLRPKRALQNYWILWEADWQDVPRDPFLLRRIGRTGDMWLVCAHFDLTEVERAALATRVSA